MMRRTLIFLFLLISALSLHSQVLEPVTWSFRSEKTGENSFELVMTADIEGNWHLYAMDIAEGGPIATSFTFETLQGCTLTGKPYAVDKPVVKFDNSFGMNIGMHSEKAEFRQKITVTKYPATVKGFVTFMSCDDKQCLPPRDVEFAFEIKGTGTAAAKADERAVAEVKAEEKPVASEPGGEEVRESVPLTALPTTEGSPIITATKTGEARQDTLTETPAQQPRKGLLKFFLLSMLAGLAGVLTPCVFPMIPMTVAFFSRGNDKKGAAIGKALIFGVSIILLYSSLGIIVSLTSAGAGFA
ncbi:MAG: hypothetical protein E4G92_06155, partial [Bacteroidia bacterium]